MRMPSVYFLVPMWVGIVGQFLWNAVFAMFVLGGPSWWLADYMRDYGWITLAVWWTIAVLASLVLFASKGAT